MLWCPRKSRSQEENNQRKKEEEEEGKGKRLHAIERHGIGGTMGPGSVPLTNHLSPRAPMGPGPKASHPRTVSRPKNTRATPRPGARAPIILNASFPNAPRFSNASSPGCFLSPSATSPNKIANRLFMI